MSHRLHWVYSCMYDPCMYPALVTLVLHNLMFYQHAILLVLCMYHVKSYKLYCCPASDLIQSCIKSESVFFSMQATAVVSKFEINLQHECVIPSYLLREVICSSEKPPSTSLTKNSLSFSSPGCTGKLLSKISGGAIKINKINNDKLKLFSWQSETYGFSDFTWNLELNNYKKAFWRQKVLEFILKCLWVVHSFAFYQIWTNEHFCFTWEENNSLVVHYHAKNSIWDGIVVTCCSQGWIHALIE